MCVRGFFVYKSFVNPDARGVSMKFSVVLDDNWTDKSSPVLVRMKNVDVTRKIDRYKALRPRKGKSKSASITVKLPEGKYDVSYVSPINSDGSMYKTSKKTTVVVNEKTAAHSVAGDSQKEQPSDSSADGKKEEKSGSTDLATSSSSTDSSASDVPQFEYIPSSQVTSEDVKAVREALKTASQNETVGVTSTDTKVTGTAVTLARSNDELQEAVKNVEASGRKAATGIVRILILRMRLNSMWARIMSLGLT